MPWPVKIFMVTFFLTIFVGSLILSRQNRVSGQFLIFTKMNWVDRSLDEFQFIRQTYLFPFGSGLIVLFAIFQMLRS